MGKDMPGPGDYNSHEIKSITYGNKNHYTIPKVSN